MRIPPDTTCNLYLLIVIAAFKLNYQMSYIEEK